MILKSWDQLPENMRTEAVRPYYDVLKKHQGSLLLKRLFDIAVSFIMLLVAWPFMLIIAIAIKLDSPGPIIFKQERVTTYGRRFKIWKFRTMVDKAEKLGSQVTVKHDSRITRVGRFLRGLRLDEVPQLINILKGDMTYVGTRPEVVKYVNQYTEEMMATLLLPAGVTSEASIRYKDEERLLEHAANVDQTYLQKVLPEKMQWNLKAIMTFSIIHDFAIMIWTVEAVVRKNSKK